MEKPNTVPITKPDSRTDERERLLDIDALLRDDVPAMKPWRVLYVEDVTWLRARLTALQEENERLETESRKWRQGSIRMAGIILGVTDTIKDGIEEAQALRTPTSEDTGGEANGSS